MSSIKFGDSLLKTSWKRKLHLLLLELQWTRQQFVQWIAELQWQKEISYHWQRTATWKKNTDYLKCLRNFGKLQYFWTWCLLVLSLPMSFSEGGCSQKTKASLFTEVLKSYAWSINPLAHILPLPYLAESRSVKLLCCRVPFATVLF